MELGPSPFLSPRFHLSTPQPQWARPKCVWGVGPESGQTGKSVQWGCVEVLWSPLPTVCGAPSLLSRQFICLCGWLAGGICLSVRCWCACAWGRSAGAPSPCGPRSVYAGAPKPALCPCVLALWFCVCACVCAFLGAVACVSLCLYGCAVVSMSLHHPCVHLRVCLSIPLLVLCPQLSLRKGGLRRSSANKLVSKCIFQPLC